MVVFCTSTQSSSPNCAICSTEQRFRTFFCLKPQIFNKDMFVLREKALQSAFLGSSDDEAVILGIFFRRLISSVTLNDPL